MKRGDPVVIIGGLAESLINFRGELLRDLVAAGHRVIAMAPAADGIAERLRRMGVEFEPIVLARTGLNPIADWRLLRHLTRRLAAIRPRAVLAYTIKPVVYGCLAASRAGVPRVVAMITGLGYAFQGSGFKRTLVRSAAILLYRRALRRTDCVLFQNEDDAALFVQLGIVTGDADVRIINGSGVDTSHYAVQPLPAQTSFLMISRLVADKGVREYAAAAQALRKVYPTVKCVLVGPADPNPAQIRPDELAAWIRSGDVVYQGEMSDVRPAIEAAAVFVLPSYREGTPRTVLEAMSMGRAIITTDAPGCRQTIVDEVSGLLVPARDVPALANAMMRCAADPELVAKLAEAARERAAERYDVRAVNRTILAALAVDTG